MQAPKWLLPLALCLPLTLTLALPTTVHAAGASPAALGHAFYQKTAYPKHGMGMKQVRKSYGKPQSVRVSQGKVKKKWPRITVWNYHTFSVYFERGRVLHTVVH